MTAKHEAYAFNSKKHTFFYNCLIMQNLDTFFRKEKNKEILKTENIQNLPELLRKIGIHNEDIPFIVTGFYSFRGMHRTKLQNLFDPVWETRSNLEKKVHRLKPEIVRLKQYPTKNILEFEEQQEQIGIVKEDLKAALTELESLPKKNTLPPNLYEYQKVKELIDKGLVKQLTSYKAQLTDKGYAIFDRASSLRAIALDRQKRGEVVSDEECTKMLGQVKSSFKNLLVRSLLQISLGLGKQDEEVTQDDN